MTLLDYSPYGDAAYTTCNPLDPDNCWTSTTRAPARTSAAATSSTARPATTSSTARPATTPIYGDGQDDSLYGNSGDDWISGGTGDDGVLGDDGLLELARNGIAEPLFGLAATTQLTLSTGDADSNDIVVTRQRHRPR